VVAPAGVRREAASYVPLGELSKVDLPVIVLIQILHCLFELLGRDWILEQIEELVELLAVDESVAALVDFVENLLDVA